MKEPELPRFTVPTWLLTPVMASALGVAIWAAGREQITDLINRVLWI